MRERTKVKKGRKNKLRVAAVRDLRVRAIHSTKKKK